ncbi:2Fe-2S iron-sulfur cluster-binding protein [Nonomuraea sp. NEAU-A123]|uniref:2Fe-2S iron-sulfur cluster-binding protein n=1 Tax=Nonomuraea sp. NEAU-A123 TaxID=2839649 RepID=UPI002032C669|nr:2Fe-2S iron-sulfur cluster-binding protein [Nonomuraea sp. NEAU-A123]
MAAHEVGSRVQDAFLAHDGLQCGYCTSGQICSTVAMLVEHRAGMPSAVSAEHGGPAALTDAEIRNKRVRDLPITPDKLM